MGFIAKVKQKFSGAGRYAPALACVGMLTAAGAALCTGDVSAATNETATEPAKWLGASLIQWLGIAVTALFAVGCLIFRDFRLVIATLIMAGLTAAITYFGL
mgnify:CR=1 FL=1|jgi:hypothetical protein